MPSRQRSRAGGRKPPGGEARARATKALRPEKPPGEAARRPRRGGGEARPPPGPAAGSVPPSDAAGAAQDAFEEQREGERGDGGSFPVVGIGASAGGLEALQQFLSAVPAQSGMAFVVVQHLDPAYQGAIVPLLQRATAMPVSQVQDGQRVEPEHVYVIPPARDMSILHGALHTLPQVGPRGLSLPVDFFFRSLAADRQERAIAVVLSGMGTDGTLGIRAVKERGGAVFVQALTSAKFDGMPRSAIETGLADVVAAADELPRRIVAYHRHASYAARAEARDERHLSALAKVFILLRSQTGNDFSLYKRSTVLRRIERRMGLHQIDKLGGYVRFLRENPKEIELLFKELLIGVTSFFRDPAVWEQLGAEALPALLASRPQGGTLRVWVPGCSTGEEAYSLAMVLREVMDAHGEMPSHAVQVFATDLDVDAIERARLGAYPANIAADVSPERLRRFFVQDERGFRITKDIRELVVFAPQNVIMDPPFTKLDVISCRNLLIYLSPEVQKKLIPLFHYALNPGGLLFLGTAETVGPYGSLFRPLDGKTRLYARLDQPATGTPADLFSRYTAAPSREAGEAEDEAPAPPPGQVPNLQVLADRVIAQRFAPAAVLTDERGDILYVSGRTGKYLEPASGRTNVNVFAMAREGLRYELSHTFQAALREDRAVTAHGVRVGTNGGTQTVDLTVQRLSQPRELRGTVMIVLADVAAPPEPARPAPRPRRGAHAAALEAELQRAMEELQSTREEMQTSQEELKSMNEELQSTNEELQSTNEELTTSKEEMQSMNEELQTVNHELQAKVDELSRSTNDMKNLFNSTDIATLFLDGELRVRRFTTQTSKLIKLIPADAGRPFTDIASELRYPELAEDAREVLRTLVFKEKEVATRDGRWFAVRILPYRTLDNVIDGVVITFTDATGPKALEAQLRGRADELRRLADSVPVLAWSGRADGACDWVSRRWFEVTGANEAELLGYGWLEQVHPEDRGGVREAWRTALRTGGALDTELRLRSAGGGYLWFKTRASPVRDATGAITRWYGTHTDVDALKRSADVPQRG